MNDIGCSRWFFEKYSHLTTLKSFVKTYGTGCFSPGDWEGGYRFLALGPSIKAPIITLIQPWVSDCILASTYRLPSRRPYKIGRNISSKCLIISFPLNLMSLWNTQQFWSFLLVFFFHICFSYIFLWCNILSPLLDKYFCSHLG